MVGFYFVCNMMNTFVWSGVVLLIVTLMMGDIEKNKIGRETGETGKPISDKKKTQLWIMFILSVIFILIGCMMK